MNNLEKTLLKTRKSIREACVEAGIEFEVAVINNIAECSHCDIWYKNKDLKPDQDKNPICAICFKFYGD